ncbi:helix-turn-helix transcriptional regulator [Runella zeae]|uniref:helix-turn-helix transcriptional regulator n=1 Tax=Runella zeae TaxID=94255 RepID=UPI00041F2B2B|nr:WYL domain-containing protein [Runella zeae]
MPATKEQLRRLMELDKFFQKGQKWKVNELLQKLSNEADIHISERTLKYDLAYLITESHGELESRKIGREWLWGYKGLNYSHFKKSLLLNEVKDLAKMIGTFKEWGDLPFWEEIEVMLNQFETRFSFENQTNRMLIDFQKPVSKNGNLWLKPLYEAIDKQQTIQVSYFSLRTKKKIIGDISPYLLKEYNNRWWLIGLFGTKIVNIALETIEDVQISGLPFIQTESFDPKTYFENVLGVTVNQEKVETIRLKVAIESVEYLRSKPIHHSQKETKEDGTELILQVVPNTELEHIILQYGFGIEVLEPPTLRKKIAKTLRLALALYESNLKSFMRH